MGNSRLSWLSCGYEGNNSAVDRAWEPQVCKQTLFGGPVIGLGWGLKLYISDEV